MVIDLTKIVQQYRGKWIGLKEDLKTVVASGETAKEVLEKSKKNGYDEPILFRIPTKVIPYVGAFHT